MAGKLEFVSTETAAEEVDLSKRTIQALIKQGKIPAKRFGKRIYLIERKAWEEWKARNITAA